MSFGVALKKEDLVKVEKLIKSGFIDLNERQEINGFACPPLCYAVLCGNIKLADLLIQHGADVGLNGRCSSPPLHFAAVKNNLQIAKLLTSNGADINQVDFTGTSALHYAATNSSFEVVEFLLGFDIIDCLITNNDGKYAADCATDELITKLLTRKQNEQVNRKLDKEIFKLKTDKIALKIAKKENELGELGKKTKKLLSEIAQKMDELAVLQQDFSFSAVELDELIAIRDKMFAKDENKNLLVKESALECLYCFELPAPPKRVFMCVNGHSFCSECGEKFTKCPQCRVPIDRKIPNHQLEHVVACQKEQ